MHTFSNVLPTCCTDADWMTFRRRADRLRHVSRGLIDAQNMDTQKVHMLRYVHAGMVTSIAAD
jgi:hypothetical protein